MIATRVRTWPTRVWGWIGTRDPVRSGRCEGSEFWVNLGGIGFVFACFFSWECLYKSWLGWIWVSNSELSKSCVELGLVDHSKSSDSINRTILHNILPSSITMKHTTPPKKPALDPIAEWRAWQALAVYFTVLLNRQLRRRWLLEQKSMQHLPVAQRFRPLLFLEPVPSLHKPILPSPSTSPSLTAKYNPYDHEALATLKTKVRLLRARVEKGKELASEIERRMLDPTIQFPTHFCHTCVVGGDVVDVLLTTCGHRVCRVCLSFGLDAQGAYECCICFAPATFVARSPLSGARSCSVQMSSVGKSKRALGRGVGAGKACLGTLVKPS